MITRLLLKSLTWRLVAVAITGTITYGVTGSVDVAKTVVAIDVAVKFFFYIAHDLLWDRV